MICDHCHKDTRAVSLAGGKALCYRCYARLEAAAPALFAALENTMTQLRRWRDEKPELWDAIIDPGMMNAWDANRAAIAKARPERSES